MIERSNAQWLADLTYADSPAKDSALTDLRERLQRGVFYYLSRERSDLADLATEEVQQMADDFAQEAVLRVLNNIESFRGDSQFTTWAMKVAVRIAITELRRSHYRDYSLDTLTANGELSTPASPAVNSTIPDRPEEATEKSDVLEKVDFAFQHDLTDRQRQALQLLILDGLPLEEVAERLDTNRNALYKLVHDARRKLRTTLESQGLSPDYILKLFEAS
jgi:RNA polymerase sigma-70 factor (ECF subfamily)